MGSSCGARVRRFGTLGMVLVGVSIMGGAAGALTVPAPPVSTPPLPVALPPAPPLPVALPPAPPLPVALPPAPSLPVALLRLRRCRWRFRRRRRCRWRFRRLPRLPVALPPAPPLPVSLPPVRRSGVASAGPVAPRATAAARPRRIAARGPSGAAAPGPAPRRAASGCAVVALDRLGFGAACGIAVGSRLAGVARCRAAVDREPAACRTRRRGPEPTTRRDPRRSGQPMSRRRHHRPRRRRRVCRDPDQARCRDRVGRVPQRYPGQGQPAREHRLPGAQRRGLRPRAGGGRNGAPSAAAPRHHARPRSIRRGFDAALITEAAPRVDRRIDCRSTAPHPARHARVSPSS